MTLTNGSDYTITGSSGTKNSTNTTGWAYDSNFANSVVDIKYYFNGSLIYTSTVTTPDDGLYPKFQNYGSGSKMTLTTYDVGAGTLEFTMDTLKSGNDYFGFSSTIDSSDWSGGEFMFYIDNTTLKGIRESGAQVYTTTQAVSDGDVFKITFTASSPSTSGVTIPPPIAMVAI